MTSYLMKFVIALFAWQTMTSSSQKTTSKKITRLARMPLYYGKRSQAFEESSHDRAKDLRMIWHPHLYSTKTFPRWRREVFTYIDDEYSPKIKGSSQHRNRSSHSIIENFYPGTISTNNNKPTQTNFETPSDSGRQINGKTPSTVNKDEFNFKRRNFPTIPHYVGHINNVHLESATWFNIKDGSEPREMNELKMISGLSGAEVFNNQFLKSPATHKMSGGGSPEPPGMIPDIRSSVFGHEQLRDWSRIFRTGWMMIAKRLKEKEALLIPNDILNSNVDNVEDTLYIVGPIVSSGYKRGSVYTGHEPNIGGTRNLGSRNLEATKRRHTSTLERMPYFYGKRSTPKRFHTLAMLYPEPQNTNLVKPFRDRTNGQNRLILPNSFPDFDSLATHIHDNKLHDYKQSMSGVAGVSNSARMGANKNSIFDNMTTQKRIAEIVEKLYVPE